MSWLRHPAFRSGEARSKARYEYYVFFVHLATCACHRVTASLEHPTAFVPTVKFGAKGVSRLDRRGILPAALFIEGVLQELAEWAQAMPGFKDAFNGERI